MPRTAEYLRSLHFFRRRLLSIAKAVLWTPLLVLCIAVFIMVIVLWAKDGHASWHAISETFDRLGGLLGMTAAFQVGGSFGFKCGEYNREAELEIEMEKERAEMERTIQERVEKRVADLIKPFSQVQANTNANAKAPVKEGIVEVNVQGNESMQEEATEKMT